MNKLYLKIWNYYSKTYLETGHFPTYEEIGLNFGFTREYVRQVMDKMQEEGYIIKPKKSQRIWLFNIQKNGQDN